MKNIKYKFSLLTLPVVGLAFASLIFLATYFTSYSARQSEVMGYLTKTGILFVSLLLLDLGLQKILVKKYPLDAKRYLNTVGLIIMVACYAYYKLVIVK